MATIPRIDLSRWLHSGAAERAAVGAEWDAAMRTTGAAVIVNHGLPPDVTLALHRATTGFFNRSEDAKRASDLRRGYGAGGYVPRGVEAVARSTGAGAGAGADPVESLTFSYGGDADAEPVAPPSPPELMPAVRAYWAAARAVLELVLAISAAALSLPDGHFDETYSREAKCNLKLAWYPAEAGACASFSASSATMRYGAHTDYTGFTILRQVRAYSLTGPCPAAKCASLHMPHDRTHEPTVIPHARALARVHPRTHTPTLPATRRTRRWVGWRWNSAAASGSWCRRRRATDSSSTREI